MKRINKYISHCASALLRTLSQASVPAALALALLLTLAFNSCHKVEIDPDLDGEYAIAFDEVTTKAIITDETLESFKVWGETEPGTANIFNGVEVTGSEKQNNKYTKWSYYTNEEDAKYWEDNKTYNFFAVAPSDLNLDYNATNGYGVEYQVPENMTADPVDMIVASAQRKTEQITDQPESVQLGFSHTLSKLQVQLKKAATNEGQAITIKEVYLYGMKGDGVYFFNTGWSLGTDAATVYRTGLAVTLNGSYQGFGEFLMIPQDLLPDSIYLIVSFDYTSRDVTTPRVQIAPIPVDDDGVKKWEATKSYTYSAEISVDQDMIFETPSVENWISNNEGGTIIIK